MGKDLSTIVRDLPVDARPRGGAARRLRPRDGHPAVPRVRVPDADRAPAGDDRRDAPATRPRRCAASRPTAPCRRRASPARPGRRAGARRDRSGRRPRAAGCSSRSTSMPSRRSTAAAGGDGLGRGRRRPWTPRTPSRRRRPADRAGRRDRRSRRGSRSTPATAIAALEPWLAAQPAVGVGLAARRPAAAARLAAGPRRRRHGRPDGRGRGPGGRRDAAPAARPAARSRSSATRSSRCSSRASPTTRTRPPTPVAFDTQIAAYILNAALRSQTIADVVAEQLDLILPPVGRARQRRPGPASRRCRRSPSASRSSGASSTTGSTGCMREIELPLIAVLARMEATGVAIDLEALAVLATRVRDRDLAARGGDLRRRRPRVQPRQPQAARAGPVLRAQPAQGQADEDRLLDRRLGARGPAARPSDDRQAPRVADLHEAALDLRRCAADADGRRRPAPHDVPPGRRRDRAAVARPTRTSRTSRSGRRSGGGSGARSWPAGRTT